MKKLVLILGLIFLATPLMAQVSTVNESYTKAGDKIKITETIVNVREKSIEAIKEELENAIRDRDQEISNYENMIANLNAKIAIIQKRLSEAIKLGIK